MPRTTKYCWKMEDGGDTVLTWEVGSEAASILCYSMNPAQLRELGAMIPQVLATIASYTPEVQRLAERSPVMAAATGGQAVDK